MMMMPAVVETARLFERIRSDDRLVVVLGLDETLVRTVFFDNQKDEDAYVTKLYEHYKDHVVIENGCSDSSNANNDNKNGEVNEEQKNVVVGSFMMTPSPYRLFNVANVLANDCSFPFFAIFPCLNIVRNLVM